MAEEDRETVRLNGWQRLWIVVSAGWVVYYLYSISDVLKRAGWLGLVAEPWTFAFIVGMAIIPPILLYGSALVAVWVIRGFRAR